MYVISAYSKNGYKEFVLPSLDNTDYRLILYRQCLGLKQDLAVSMEILKGIWKICPSEGCRIYCFKKKVTEPEDLREGMLIQLLTRLIR